MTDLGTEEAFDYWFRTVLQEQDRLKVWLLFDQSKNQVYLGKHRWRIDGYEVVIPPHLLPAGREEQ